MATTKISYPQGGSGLSTLGTAGQLMKVNSSADGVEWGDAPSSGISFGGDGSDGALSVTSGTTNIDASSASVVIKEYTSISISSGATLALTNPASTGTILILKSQGDVTIEGTIDLSGDGSAAETDPASVITETGGNAATVQAGGTEYPFKMFYTTYNDGYFDGAVRVACGAGGANGNQGTGNGGGPTAGGSGGRGGGALIIECGGAFDFDSGGTINLDGSDGTNGANAGAGSFGTIGGGGGGGGGSAGMAAILYKTLTDNSGTVSAKGGDGGNGGSGDAVYSGGSCQGGWGGGGGGALQEDGETGGTGGTQSTNSNPGVSSTTSAGSSGGGGGGDASHQAGGTGGSSTGADTTDHYVIMAV